MSFKAPFVLKIAEFWPGFGRALPLSSVRPNCVICSASYHIRGSIVVSISACHAEDQGSIPGRGVSLTTSARRQVSRDTLAERLRRRPAKPMGSPRVGSNPTGVAYVLERVLSKGLLRELSPGPLAPEARIMPLDQAAGDGVVPNCSSNFRYSLAGLDTRLSPERPGFESRWRNMTLRAFPCHGCAFAKLHDI